MINIPVALFGFRRPDLLQGALEQLVEQKVRRVHVILDAAPNDQPDMVEPVSLCRKVLEKKWAGIDLIPHLAKSNLGCQQRVLTGLDAVFENEKEAIILEDDIRAGPDFFALCAMVLSQLSADNRIGSVCGTALKGIRQAVSAPVFLSRYTGSWGWATWRDRWQKFRADNLQLAVLDQVAPPGHLGMGKEEWSFWRSRIGQARSGLLDSWAYPWRAFCWEMEWLTVRPSSNLTKNLGFEPRATHTKEVPPGVVMQFEQWTLPSPGELKNPCVGIGDHILSDWIRPGSDRLSRKFCRFLRGFTKVKKPKTR